MIVLTHQNKTRNSKFNRSHYYKNSLNTKKEKFSLNLVIYLDFGHIEVQVSANFFITSP